jgi:hypothetical protein
MKKIKTASRVILTFVTLLQTNFAQAAAAPTPEVTGEWIEIAGQPVRWILSDGREATFQFMFKEIFDVDLDYRIKQSGCGDFKQPTVCQLKTFVRPYGLRVVWTQHSDPAKVGQVVRLKFNSERDSFPIKDSYFTDLPNDLWSLNLPAIPRYQLTCNNFSWIPGGSDSAPERVSISSWSKEYMKVNIETGAAENASGGGVDLECSRSGQNRIRVDSYTPVEINFGGSLVSQGNTGVTFVDSSGAPCLVEFETENYAKFGRDFTRQREDSPVVQDWQDFVHFGTRGQRNLITDDPGDIANFQIVGIPLWGLLE